MTGDSSQSKIQTKPLGENPKDNIAKVYTLAYLRWEREWFETFDTRRARLLNLLSHLNEEMTIDSNAEYLRYFLLGGQTVLLEDIASIRPDLLTMLVIFNAGGRLALGPWYVNVDETFVSGEALIRNLLAARDDASRYGLKLLNIAYNEETSSHIAQLPQILRGFGINAAFLRHSAGPLYVPVRWEAPDGSYVLLVNYDIPMVWPRPTVKPDTFRDDLNEQATSHPDGPFLWMYELTSTEDSLSGVIPTVQKATENPVIESDMVGYIRALRQELPDSTRPTLQGELRFQPMERNAFLFPGTLSARLYLKQENNRLQTMLERNIEPWMAVALTHGNIEYPDNTKALVDYCWRLLMRNQTTRALGGTGSDPVHRENEERYRRINDTAEEMVYDVFSALPGTPHRYGTPTTKDTTYIVVRNALNWPRQQMVDVKVDVPNGLQPTQLLSPEGEDVPFKWAAKDGGGVISFIGVAPGLGYATYTLKLSDQAPTSHHATRRTSGTSIGNVDGDTLSVENDQLVWRRGNHTITDLLNFYDGGDAGDVFNYSPPDPDVIVKADLAQNVEVESSPLYERLILHHRMRVAPSLGENRGRERGLKLIELTTTATFYDHIPGVFFRTSFNNSAMDHRLRVHLRTGLLSNSILTDTPFAVVPRPVMNDLSMIVPEKFENTEGIVPTHPLHQVASVQIMPDALALSARGLPEFEAIREGDQLTFALTLVRAVGWLSRDDLRTRTTTVAPHIPIPDAQCQRDITAEYALAPVKFNDPAALVRAGMILNVPLYAYQYDEPPKRPTRSYLSVISDRGIGAESDGEGVIVTGFKPAHRGTGWTVRFFNPHSHPVEVLLTPFKRAETIHLVSINEQPESFLDSDANGRVGLMVQGNEIVTVRFGFT